MTYLIGDLNNGTYDEEYPSYSSAVAALKVEIEAGKAYNLEHNSTTRGTDGTEAAAFFFIQDPQGDMILGDEI